MVTAVPKKNKFNKNGREHISGNGEFVYIPVVDGKELSYIAESEDIALLIGIGYKYDGRNSQFVKMACRMLQLKSVYAD